MSTIKSYKFAYVNTDNVSLRCHCQRLCVYAYHHRLECRASLFVRLSALHFHIRSSYVFICIRSSSSSSLMPCILKQINLLRCHGFVRISSRLYAFYYLHTYAYLTKSQDLFLVCIVYNLNRRIKEK